MGSLIRRIFSNASTRMLVLVFVCIILITTFFLVYGYFQQIALLKESEFHKLESIAKTTALSLDGDKHERLLAKYPNSSGLKTRNQDSTYSELHELLWEIKNTNKLKSDIYTIIREKVNGESIFYFGINSRRDLSPEETFRSVVMESQPGYLKTLDEYFERGVTLPEYRTPTGHWLSAFHPFKNRYKDVTGIIQVDSNFTEFIEDARKKALLNSLFSIGFVIILALFLVNSAKKILSKEEDKTKELIKAKILLEGKNKDVTDSINYAKRIQQAIVPSTESLKEYLPNSFIFLKPKDIVSGDFYWFSEHNGKLLVAAADCTGHGIPGALMSMIGSSLLNEFVNHQSYTDPGQILDHLEQGIGKAFSKNNTGGFQSKDGMDISICSIDLKSKELKFAGAFRPLIQVSNGNHIEIKGDRFPIGGGTSYVKTKFTTRTITTKPGDYFYMFSDGYPDQFGGPKQSTGGKKMKNKKFIQLLKDIESEPSIQKEQVLDEELVKWQGKLEQVDDILVIGFSL